MTEGLLVAEGLTKRYDDVHVVRDVSLAVGAGEVLALVGPNGAGKTTLVDLLAGVQEPDAGTVMLRGRRTGVSRRQNRRHGVARSQQHPRRDPDMSAEDHILRGRLQTRMRGVGATARTLLSGMAPSLAGADRGAAEAMCRMVRIERPERRWAELSLAERRLVEVARALVQDPEVVILDEPFAGGDAVVETAVRRAVHESRRRGRAVILVDHDVATVASMADRMALMAEGAIVFQGDPDACVRSTEMRRIYFGDNAP